jgi:hypothetical protein
MNKIFQIESKVPYSFAKLYVTAVPTSSLVESCFGWVIYLLSEVGNCLDVVRRDDLCLSLTTLQPDIQKFANVYQAHGTH